MTIISLSRKFLFIKTTKTAGTSLEVHLSKWMDDFDIVTPITPSNPDHTPRNFELNGQVEFYNHMSFSEIKNAFKYDLSDLFSFCFERHPISKCLSYFAMLKNSPFHQSPNNPGTWDEYVERGIFPVDTPKYVDRDGALLVKRIFRYEHLEEALSAISHETAIPRHPLTVREKSGFRVGVPSFADVAGTVRHRNRIMDAFESSLAFTPYEYDRLEAPTHIELC